jgi:hypothetical protein
MKAGFFMLSRAAAANAFMSVISRVTRNCSAPFVPASAGRFDEKK